MLFTCLNSRAVHIEAVPSMNTDAFINALRRFISIRGPIRLLRCDRGTNFMGGIRQLQQRDEKIEESKVQTFLTSNDCEFKVNAPSASYQGSVWEHQIRSARNVLQSLLVSEGRQLDDDGLRTIMYEAANIVNSRPITLTNEPNSLRPLTPNMLLHMKSSVVFPPPGVFQNADKYSPKRWRRVQHLANCFWHRWRKEFLQLLQERSKWCRPKRNLQVGDIVVVTDDVLPRCVWKLGRIVEVFPGTDGLVRRVRFVQWDPTLSKIGKRNAPL